MAYVEQTLHSVCAMCDLHLADALAHAPAHPINSQRPQPCGTVVLHSVRGVLYAEAKVGLHRCKGRSRKLPILVVVAWRRLASVSGPTRGGKGWDKLGVRSTECPACRRPIAAIGMPPSRSFWSPREKHFRLHRTCSTSKTTPFLLVSVPDATLSFHNPIHIYK